MKVSCVKVKLIYSFVAMAILAWSPSPFHVAFAYEDDNPYLQLYQLRVSQAAVNHERRIALFELAEANLRRGEQLLPRNVISRQEYDALVAEARATRAEVELASQKIDEAKAYLRIIEGLVARGVNIPLCTYEME